MAGCADGTYLRFHQRLLFLIFTSTIWAHLAKLDVIIKFGEVEAGAGTALDEFVLLCTSSTANPVDDVDFRGLCSSFR